MAPEFTFDFNGMEFADQGAFVRSGRRCATAIPTDLQLDRVAGELSSYRASAAPEVDRATIDIQFIHITDGSEGRIGEEQRVEQVTKLNHACAWHGIEFTYDAETVMEVDRREWFRMGHRSASERAAKSALHVDAERHLNFYTAGLERGLTGWATFPFDLRGDPVMDGVVLYHESLPGGSAAPYNLGATAIHQIGHWLGLYHSFEPRGSCDPLVDRVPDVVPHRNPDFGKPVPGVYTACDGRSNSPLKNFMNYTDDDWMDHFTQGQGQRMREHIGLYRSGLLESTTAASPQSFELPFSAVATGQLSRTGASQIYSVDLPGNATVTLGGPAGVDLDLYIRRDAPPTTEEYDERSHTSGPGESLSVKPATPGRYFIMARSKRGAGGFTLKVELD